jgi:Flp pilus assembly protein CpaB
VLKNYKLWLVAAVLLAFAAGMISVVTIRNFSATEKAFATASDITPVTPELNLAPVDVARGNLYPDTVRSETDLMGVIPKGFIPAGTVLRKSMFQPVESAGMSGKLAMLGNDRVAIAIPNDLYTSIAGNLAEGDIVDVYLRPKGTMPELALANVPVLQGATTVMPEGEQTSQGIVLAIPAGELSKILQGMQGDQSMLLVLKPILLQESGQRS